MPDSERDLVLVIAHDLHVQCVREGDRFMFPDLP